MPSGIHHVTEKLRHSLQSARWRTSISEWWYRSAEDGKYKTDAKNFGEPQKNYSIPKLPVPDLQHTLTRYLEALQPILKEEQFSTTRSLVRDFGAENGVGEGLQQSLKKRREIYDNWVYDWWLDDMYLNNLIALPVNSNPGMVFPLRSFSSPSDMAKFAARVVSCAVDYKDKIDKNELPVETVITDGVPQLLCMAQYSRIFTSYRAPGMLKDELLKTETEFTKARPHIIVAFREQFYVVHLTKGKNAQLLTENELASQFSHILNESNKSLRTSLPIGIMTGLKRDRWANVREQLLQDNDNKRNLSFIEKCMLIICFDCKELPSSFNSKCSNAGAGGYRTATRDETNMAHQMLHGGGSNFNSGNRWFDKTVQLVIGSDGVNGLCYEHSSAEGVAVINAVETILGCCNDLDTIIIDPQLTTIPERLTWNFSSDIEKEVRAGIEIFDKNVSDLDFNVFRFNGYGKSFIKSCRCSPDAFVQLALQLAYFKVHGRLVATYESASTRRFLLGRVDCIRATTMEVLNWVSSMENNITKKQNVYTSATESSSKVTVEKKLQLFEEALRKQKEITTENITGHGIDIHLLGLRQMARDHMIQTELFKDEAYAIANHFSLSTSQVATKTNSFMGYGPVVPDGYGASYNPKETSIIFCISSFRSNSLTSTNKFSESLRDSLNSMRDLLEYRK